MYRILNAQKLADKIFLMDVYVPRIAANCQPGQFVIVKIGENVRESLLRSVIITE